MRLINFITHYRNDSIFCSDQYGHYTQGYKLFKDRAIKEGFSIVENQKIIENSIVIFRDLPKKELVTERPSGTIFILQIWECPIDRPSLFTETNWEYFDLVISCNTTISNKKHRTINYFIDDDYINNDYVSFNDRKLAIALCSNRYNGILASRKGSGFYSLPILQEISKEWKNNYFNIFFKRPLVLYSRRRYFLNKKFTFFELYGRFWSKKHLQSWVRIIYKFLPERFDSKGEYIGNKIELLKNYKFSMAFENYENNTSYISEKIFECFKAGSVPLYSGCKNIFDHIPDDCYIYISNKDSRIDVKKKIENMDKKTWEKYIINGQNFLKSDKYLNEFSAQAFSNKLFKYIEEVIGHNLNNV